LSLQYKFLIPLFAIMITHVVYASDIESQYKTAKDDGALELINVVDDVYAIVGPLGNRSPENLGNNATFGFIVTSEGVVVIDPGGTYLGAKKIHELIKTVTSKPVTYVINTGGQDHRWLGNGYYKALNARIIASKDAVRDQKSRVTDIMFRLGNTAGDEALQGTSETYAEIVFDEIYKFQVGDKIIEVHHPGAAHSPGDSFVWLPQLSVIFSGDVIYLDRMLSVMSFSNSKAWLIAFDKIAAINPKYLVPGHGKPATLSDAKRQTYGYLTMLRQKIGVFMDEGGVIQDVGKIDQSEFSYLENYDLLKGRNIQQVYQEMEWE